MKASTPAILVITLVLIALQFLINATVRPLFNEAIRRYNHHCFIEARRKEFYSGLSAIMNSAQTPGHRG